MPPRAKREREEEGISGKRSRNEKNVQQGEET
jgi:hypothetical protein